MIVKLTAVSGRSVDINFFEHFAINRAAIVDPVRRSFSLLYQPEDCFSRFDCFDVGWNSRCSSRQTDVHVGLTRVHGQRFGKIATVTIVWSRFNGHAPLSMTIAHAFHARTHRTYGTILLVGGNFACEISAEYAARSLLLSCDQ